MALFGGGNDQEMKVTIRAKDDASKDINKVQTSLGRLAGGFALGTVAVAGFQRGMSFLSSTLTQSVAKHEQHVQVQNRLVHILRQATDASDDNIRALIDQAAALEKVGVVSQEAIMAAQGTLATFDLQADSIRRLIPAFLDMVVAERGVNATTDDMIGLANGLGKVLQGQVGALSKQGFVFNAYQEELLKTGTETEKVATLTQILSSTYGGLNESSRATAGSTFTLQQRMDDLQKSIGSGVVPAMNNLFSAFEKATAGMGDTADVGKVVFRTFAAIGEFAANTATGIRYLAGEMVKFSSRQLQWTLGPLNAIKSVRQGFEDFRESVDEGTDTFVDFALDLKNRNQAVLDTWNDLTLEARNFGRVGPAAYGMTAKEAEEAAKAMKKAQEAVADTRRELEGIHKALMSDEEAAARAFAEQEGKVSDLRKRATLETDPERKAELMAEISREAGALDRARPMFYGEMAGVLDAARKRALLTDFEREIGDIRARTLERIPEANQVIVNLNAQGSVLGDAGIREMLERIVRDLNRQSALLRAGA